MEGLRIRKLADRSAPREVRYRRTNGERVLIDPATGQESPRPFLGIEFVGDPPKETCVSQSYINDAALEGWVDIENLRIVQRSKGPKEMPVSAENPPHVFQHADAIIFKTVTGDVRYKVLHNPDKYPEEKEDSDVLEDYGFGGEVFWTYHLELEDDGRAEP